MINITHWDPDGVFCSYLLMKKFGDKFKIYYSSPQTLIKDLLNIIRDNDKEEIVYVTDIPINQEAIFLLSYFSKVYVIDHHKIENNFELTSRVNIYVKEYKSASRVLAEYLNIKSDLLDIIDDIDSNDIKNDLERDFRDIFSAIRYNYKKDFQIHFTKISRDLYLYENIGKIVSSYQDLLNKFRKKIEEIEKKIDTMSELIYLNNIKVLFVYLDEGIPSSFFLDRIKNLYGNLDYIIFIYRNSKKGEIRTLNNKNVLELAKYLGGGGHFYAGGFRYENEEDVKRKIRDFLYQSL